MVDKINGLGKENSDYLRQITQKMAADTLQQKAADTGQGQAGAVQEIGDARQVSEEALEELNGKADQDGSNIENILKGILELKSQDHAQDKNPEAAGEEGAAAEAENLQQPQQANGPAEAEEPKKKQVEEIKVEWSPLMKEGQTIDTGQPWGHFKITREKKEVEDKQGQQGNRPPVAAPQGAPLTGAQGAAGGKGGSNIQGTSAVQKNQEAGKPAGDNSVPKGSDGKTPAALQGSNPLEDPKEQKKGKDANVEVAEGGKVYILDEGTGEKIEVPENGEIKATHPMKIVDIGQTGELKPGDKLFTYENPKPEELEKARKTKDQGIPQGQEDDKRK